MTDYQPRYHKMTDEERMRKIFGRWEYTRPGDPNGDNALGVSDAVCIIDHGALIFRGRDETIIIAIAPGQWAEVWRMD